MHPLLFLQSTLNALQSNVLLLTTSIKPRNSDSYMHISTLSLVIFITGLIEGSPSRHSFVSFLSIFVSAMQITGVGLP